MIVTSRAERRQLERDNAKLPAVLARVPRNEWPVDMPGIEQVWRSRDFLVQVYPPEAPGVRARLSIHRTTLNGAGRWVDGITWDDLQRLKGECGFAHCDAVEVYPAQCDVVNVANIRHLWVMDAPVPFAWRKK